MNIRTLIIYIVFAIALLPGSSYGRTYDVRDGLSDNYVRAITADSAGMVYISTLAGIDVFDGYTPKPLRIAYPAEFKTKRLLVDASDRLWGLSGGKMYMYDGRGFVTSDAAPFDVLAGKEIVDISMNGRDFAVIIKNRGLYQYDSATGSFSPVSADTGGYDRVFLDQNGRIWLFDGLQNGVMYYYRNSRHKVSLFDGMQVKALGQYNDASMAVATNSNGLWIMDNRGNLVRRVVSDPDDRYSLPSDHISALLCRQGEYVAGTTKSGIYVAPTDGLVSKKVRLNTDADISFFSEQPVGNLWIGFDGAGLGEYMPGTSKPVAYYSATNSGLQSDLVVGVSKGPGERLFGTYGAGLFRIPPYGAAESLSLGDSLSHCRNIYSFADGRILAGTFSKGLSLIGRKGFRMDNSVLATNCITGLAAWRDEILVSSSTGLYRFNPKSESLTLSGNSSLDSISVNVLFVDSGDRVWLGSYDGLMVLDGKLKVVASIKTENGLSNNIIRAITEDREGRIWVTTANGINCIERHGDTYRCTPFYASDGIGDINFGRYSIACDSSGHILAGGNGEYIVVDASRYKTPNRRSKVYFTGLIVDGRDVLSGDSIRGGRVPLSSDMLHTEKLVLDYYHSFMLEVSTLSANSAVNTRYMYSIDDGEWIPVKGHMIAPGELSPGKHNIRVRTADSDVVSVIEVDIMPPFWKSAWANTFYTLLSLGLLAMSLLWLMKRRRKELAEQRLDSALDRQEDLPPSADELFISKARSVVEANMADEDFSVEAFSAAMSMSRSNLYKRMSSATGQSPIEFMRKIRIREGRRRLDAGATAIAQVAYSVGISPKSFSKYFKNEYGMTPSAYLEQRNQR